MNLVRDSYSYRNLSEDALKSVILYMETLGYLRFVEPDRIAIRSARCRNYYLENLSMIPDERRYNVVDLTNQQKVGILGEEFMMLHAEVGVHFIIKAHVWQIESIQGENVYVTPIQDPSASVPGWDGELLPIPKEVAMSVGKERRLLEKELFHGKEYLIENSKAWNADRNARSQIINEVERQAREFSLHTDERIVVEKYDRYLVIHTSAGDRINLTLGELFEEILLRKGLVRHWWNDGYRIMIELTTEEFEVKEISSLLLDFNNGTKGFLKAVIRKHFPFGYYMKFIAERFGALHRGLMVSGEGLKDLVVKFRFTPIYEETLREALMLKVDEEGSISLLEGCKEGRIEVRSVESKDAPSPLGMYIFSRYGEMLDSDPESSMNSIESMRNAISKEVISLLCFKCGNLSEFVSVSSLPDNPQCQSCASSLLAPIFYGVRFAQFALQKKMDGNSVLTEQETEMITKARRSADVVLSYGKMGIIAQCAYGIGPQTASKILSKMHSNEEDFYSDLLEAKLNFIRTRQYWN